MVLYPPFARESKLAEMYSQNPRLFDLYFKAEKVKQAKQAQVEADTAKRGQSIAKFNDKKRLKR